MGTATPHDGINFVCVRTDDLEEMGIDGITVELFKTAEAAAEWVKTDIEKTAEYLGIDINEVEHPQENISVITVRNTTIEWSIRKVHRRTSAVWCDPDECEEWVQEK